MSLEVQAGAHLGAARWLSTLRAGTRAQAVPGVWHGIVLGLTGIHLHCEAAVRALCGSRPAFCMGRNSVHRVNGTFSKGIPVSVSGYQPRQTLLLLWAGLCRQC